MYIACKSILFFFYSMFIVQFKVIYMNMICSEINNFAASYGI